MNRQNGRKCQVKKTQEQEFNWGERNQLFLPEKHGMLHEQDKLSQANKELLIEFYFRSKWWKQDLL